MRRLTQGIAAAVGGVVIAGGSMVAFASIPDGSNVFHGCELNGLGTIRLIDPSLPSTSLLSHCISGKETAITWNQQGPPGPAGQAGANGTNGANGKDGTSVTASPLPVGDVNCPGGGSSFASATGTTYACNGTNGRDGANGKDGTSLTDITQLNRISCKATDGSTGTVSVVVSGSNDIAIKCVPPPPPSCTPISHSAGYGTVQYQDCAALGTPGDPSTYTLQMATEAAQTTQEGRFLTWSVMPVPGCLGDTIGLGQMDGGDTLIYIIWAYSGPYAGHVISDVTDPTGIAYACPLGTDPTWN
jgi:hypothetical protein